MSEHIRPGVLARVAAIIVGFALLFAGAAAGANQTFPSKLSIEANRTQLKRGGDVTISGTLSSRSKPCRRRQTVSLFGTGRTDRTGWSGRYKFRLAVDKTTTFRAVFDGSKIGTGPDTITCLKSKSSAVTVVVSRQPHQRRGIRARGA